MQSATQTAATSKKTLWAGRSLSLLPILFLLFDTVFKLLRPTPTPVVEAFNKLGYPPTLAVTLGVLLLACVVVYMIPKTAVLGAILLTGYLGGAVATHLRVGDPLFSHVLFPVYMGLFIWGGLYFRDERLRVLIPLRG
jgi:DoxX-like family